MRRELIACTIDAICNELLIAPQAEDQLVDAVLSASRVLVAIAARSLADVGEEVTFTQYRSLVVLASRGPQGVAALADAVSVTPPTASRMCDRLVKKGLVTRRTDRRDRRQVRIALSPGGRRLVDTVTARRRLEIEQLVASIPDGVPGRGRRRVAPSERDGG